MKGSSKALLQWESFSFTRLFCSFLLITKKNRRNDNRPRPNYTSQSLHFNRIWAHSGLFYIATFQVFLFLVVQRKEHLKESILFQSILILCIRHSKGHSNKGTIIFVQSFPSIQKMKIVYLLFASRASLQCDVSSGLFSVLPPDSKDYFMRRFWFCRGVKQAYSQRLNLGVRSISTETDWKP